MKFKIIAILLAVLLCFCVGCNNENVSSENISSYVTEISSENESIISSESVVESVVSVTESIISIPANNSVQSSPDSPPLVTLSNEKFGFSFGVAKNGQPHSQSINNQKKFDSLEGVSALALDTKTPIQEKVLYLTFDCGYEYQGITGQILDVLKEKNVKAAFFCTKDYIVKNSNFVNRMINEGHIVGNHSTTHPVFPDISRNKMKTELAGMNDYMKSNYGYSTKYFRFPTGAYSHNALELVTSCGYKSIFWSLAYSDWDTGNQKGTQYAFDTVTARLHPGSVMLLHAVSIDNANALPQIIDYAINNGYTFKTLDDYYAK